MDNYKLPRISLEQWLTFKTVVDKGSYAMAAETLSKSQSSVSYAITRLNEQLPKAVLHLEGRRAVMTEEGKVLYRYANQLIKQASETEAIAASMAMGFESEVTIAVDVLLEIGSLVCAFEKFSQQFPHTRIRVLETSLSGTTEALVERKADVVIGSHAPVGHVGIPLGQLTMIPVAAPGHELIDSDVEISELELRGYRQVVLRDTGTRAVRDAGWLGSEQRWTVSHFSSSITLIKSGLVFAFLPRNWIISELESGELCQIPIQEGMERTISISIFVTDKTTAGPASKALAELVVKNLKLNGQ